MNLIRVSALLVGALVLAGCETSTQVVVQSSVPEATVDQLPLRVAVYYDASLKAHAFVEDSPERKQWRIESGGSQVEMFRQVFANLFEDVVEVDSPNAAASDVLITPEIVDIQFATPRETRLEFYEAWLKYALHVRDSSGDPVARWVFTAYGKSPTEFMKWRAEGINAAMEQALRAAGAKVITQFKQVPEIKQWLEKSGRG